MQYDPIVTTDGEILEEGEFLEKMSEEFESNPDGVIEKLEAAGYEVDDLDL